MADWTAKRDANQAKMRTFRFGVEVETIGLARDAAARAVASVVGGTVTYMGGSYDTWGVVDAQGRTWKAMRDGSLSSPTHAEVVTPPLAYTDIDTLQRVVRALRAAGTRADSSCGIHVHVDAGSLDIPTLARLARTVYRHEEMIEKGIKMTAARKATFCRGVDANFVERLQREAPETREAMGALWYGRENFQSNAQYHYDQSRYHGLNLHSVFFRGTVEFRWFNGTMHAGKVKAYAQFCMALVADAVNGRAIHPRPATAMTLIKYHTWLRRLGLDGAEFATARQWMKEGFRAQEGDHDAE